MGLDVMRMQTLIEHDQHFCMNFLMAEEAALELERIPASAKQEKNFLESTN